MKAIDVIKKWISLLLIPVGLMGQDSTLFKSDLQTPQKPWTHLDFANDPNHFQFAIITDRTGGPRPGVFEDAVQKLNWLMPEFVITIGDLIRGAKGKDVKTLDKQWAQHFERIAPLKMPFFHLAGNHDIKANNQFQVDYWNQKFGATYYSFVYKNVLFLNLFTNEGTQIISEDQVAYFKEVIKKNPEVRWTMVFMHHPLWRYPHFSNFDQIEALLKDKDYTVFAGHQHRYHHSLKDNKNYYVLATTGGGSELLGNSFGTFDHVTWVTMSDQGPILANLRLDGILPHDVANDETQQLTQDLLNSVQVKTTVLVDSKVNCKKGIAYITYRNHSDHPLHLKARFFHSHHFQAAPDILRIQIPPNTSKTIPIQLDAISPFNLEKEAVQIEYTGSIGYQLEDFPDLFLEGSVIIPIQNDEYDLLPTSKVAFVDSYMVTMNPPLPKTEIHYTLDGSDPDSSSPIYEEPIRVNQQSTLKARLISKDHTLMSAVDEMTLKPVVPGPGLMVECYAYEQLGKRWGGISDFEALSPIEIKACKILDPIKVAGRKDQFGLIYKGQIKVPESGSYTFNAISDDAVQLMINKQIVLSDPVKHKARATSGTIHLTKGKHAIEIQYFQWKRNYALDLEMVTPNGTKHPLNAKILSFDQHSITQ